MVLLRITAHRSARGRDRGECQRPPQMANALLEKEVLSLEDIEKVFGPRPFATREGSNIDRYRGIRKELEGEGARQEAPGKGKPSPPGESDVGEPSPSM